MFGVMKQPIVIAMAGALLSCAALASAAPATKAAEAQIPFANHGTIDNWQADGRSALYLQGPGRQWYHAELMGPCLDLDYAEAIGIETRGTGNFDRFGSIIVRGQPCALTSLVKSGPPPKKVKG